VKGEIIESQGDISLIEAIPDHLKSIYKTAFTVSPYAVVEVAARAQKWVDQALSRNMYLETRDIDETMNIYESAWKKGLKTTYYLHMKPRHTAEQSTVAVNKAQKMGKVGFGAISGLASALEIKEEVVVAREPVPSPVSVPLYVPESVGVLESPKEEVFARVEAIQKAPESAIEIPKPKGFAAVSSSQAAHVCPIDPAEKALCDSCQ
jgi:ribonucleoside-diphosphate reductase alpha chain